MTGNFLAGSSSLRSWKSTLCSVETWVACLWSLGCRMGTQMSELVCCCCCLLICHKPESSIEKMPLRLAVDNFVVVVVVLLLLLLLSD